MPPPPTGGGDATASTAPGGPWARPQPSQIWVASAAGPILRYLAMARTMACTWSAPAWPPSSSLVKTTYNLSGHGWHGRGRILRGAAQTAEPENAETGPAGHGTATDPEHGTIRPRRPNLQISGRRGHGSASGRNPRRHNPQGFDSRSARHGPPMWCENRAPSNCELPAAEAERAGGLNPDGKTSAWPQ
eukprot:9488844-Pyramimonas_sp.AAC.4